MIGSEIPEPSDGSGTAPRAGSPRWATRWPRSARPVGLALLAVVCALAGAVLLSGVAGPSRHPGAVAVRDEVPATASDELRQPANNSPVVVADPTDERRLALANRLDAPDFGCALQLSGDGGRSWVPAKPVAELPQGADKCYAPEVAFDGNGRLFYLFVGLQGQGNQPMGAFLTSSIDGGRTFGTAWPVLGRLSFGVRMAIDRSSGGHGRIHLVWLHARADPPLGGFPTGPNPSCPPTPTTAAGRSPSRCR